MSGSLINSRSAAFLDLFALTWKEGEETTYSPYLFDYLYDVKARHKIVLAVCIDPPPDAYLLGNKLDLVVVALSRAAFLPSLYATRQQYAINLNRSSFYTTPKLSTELATLMRPEIRGYVGVPRNIWGPR